MPRQTNGLVRGFQLWINLPSFEKMSSPEYQEFERAQIPEMDWQGATIRVLSGSLGETTGPIEDHITRLRYLDIRMPETCSISLPMDERASSFAYVYDGAVRLSDDTPLGQHQLGIINSQGLKGESLKFRTSDEPVNLILVSGHPIGEPIVQQGPCVMNTQEEIKQAVDDYQHGKLVRGPGVR
jgi:hypothetical protein